MKKIFLIVITIVLPMVASAYDAEIDGVYYNLDTSTMEATVTSGDTKYTGNVTIPETVTYENVTYSVESIGRNAFYGCSGLTSVKIGNSVTSIGKSAFNNCINLTSINIPNSVDSIGESAFFLCRGLTCIIIPNSVKTIGASAFLGCSGLYSVTIGNSVTYIGAQAFSGCSGLKKVITPNIASWCAISFVNNWSNPLFYAHHLYSDTDTEITDLVIPNSVTSIGILAFSVCSGLTSITIPSSVTSIGDLAFSNCNELRDVYCYAENVPTTETSAFNNTNIENATLHVPAVSIESYKKNEYWSGFGTIVALTEEELTGIQKMSNDKCQRPNAIYDLSGRQLMQSRKGVNILRYGNGKTCKVLTK